MICLMPAWRPGTSYDGMAIADGGTAAREFVRVMFGDGNADREPVLEALQRYCALDTIAMLDLLRALAARCFVAGVTPASP